MESADELVKLKNLVKAQDLTAKQLRSEVAHRDKRIRELEMKMEATRRKLLICNVPHPDQRAEVETLRHTLERTGARVADIERSLSWRITAPLRSIGGMFR